MKSPRHTQTLALIALLLSSCFGSARKEAAEIDEIYFEYVVNAEEGNDSVAVLFRFKEFDEYGEAISIDPGSVSLDGEIIAADSTAMTGPFYAVNRSVASFTGKHQVLVTLPDQKKYKDEFQFRPFSLKAGLPDTISRSRFQLDFEGLQNGETVRLLMTDTSFTGDGIHRIDTVWHNRIGITKYELSALESGPINLELSRESVRKLRNTTTAGGSISITYSIRRECWLRD